MAKAFLEHKVFSEYHSQAVPVETNGANGIKLTYIEGRSVTVQQSRADVYDFRSTRAHQKAIVETQELLTKEVEKQRLL